LNDYGRVITPSNDNNEYIINGEKQNCPKPNDWENCYMEELVIKINEKGDKL